MSKPTKGIQIHGKTYMTVAERVNDFRNKYGDDYGIITEIIQDGEVVQMLARIENADQRTIATGFAEERRGSTQINKTSALENCETSAIGRALANLGFGGTEYASANEVENAIHQQMAGDQRGGQSQEGAVSPPANHSFPEGPASGITALKTWQRNIWPHIEAATDKAELEEIIEQEKAYFKQASNLPEGSKWRADVWEGDGEDNIGLRGLVNLKRQELEQPNILQAG